MYTTILYTIYSHSINCVVLIDEEVKKIFLGKPLNLDSTFHLGYNMLLNLMRIEDTTPEYLIERSFMQFQVKNKSVEISSKLKESKIKLETLRSEFDSGLFLHMSSLEDNKEKLEKLTEKSSDIVMSDTKSLNYLNYGRLVYVKNDQIWGWAICISPPKLKLNNPKVLFTMLFLVILLLSGSSY